MPIQAMLPSLLVAAGSLVLLGLGAAHLLLTFRGRKLYPRDEALIVALQSATPVLTRQTTMWRMWIGFNASHSFGGILFGLIYAYLALAADDFLFRSVYLQSVGLLVLGGYLFLGKRYWFSVPFRGIVLATALFSLGILLRFWR
jgi:hypothetical protein